MPTIKGNVVRPSIISSDTKWIKMHAILDEEPSPHDISREYLLTINISGLQHEFLAAEGYKGYPVTLEEAKRCILEFESTMESENQNYAVNKFTKLLKSI